MSDYKLIPFSEIPDDAREIAVAWCDGYERDLGSQIHQKHKLASDLVNYRNQGMAALKARIEEEIKFLENSINQMDAGARLAYKTSSP